MNGRFCKTRLTVAALALLAVPGAVLHAQDEVGIARGTMAPSVQLEDLEGNPVDLGGVIGGRPALLEFWASWCEVCKALAPSMERAFRRYGDSVSFVVVAVAVGESPRTVRRYVEDHPSGYRFLYDAKGRAVRAFSVPTTAYVVIVDGEGKVIYTGVGADQDLEAAVGGVLNSTGTQ